MFKVCDINNMKTLKQIQDKITKTIQTAHNAYKNHSDSSRAKETKKYNELETRYIALCEALISHPEFSKSGLNKDSYSVDSFGEYVF